MDAAVASPLGNPRVVDIVDLDEISDDEYSTDSEEIDYTPLSGRKRQRETEIIDLTDENESSQFFPPTLRSSNNRNNNRIYEIDTYPPPISPNIFTYPLLAPIHEINSELPPITPERNFMQFNPFPEEIAPLRNRNYNNPFTLPHHHHHHHQNLLGSHNDDDNRETNILDAFLANFLLSSSRNSDKKQKFKTKKLKKSEIAEDDCCCICLEEYRPGDKVKVLPCSHFFHPKCISDWMKVNRICPVDRKEL